MLPNLASMQAHSQTFAYQRLGLSAFGLDEVEVLLGLGLSNRQARAYLALLKVGKAKAKAIADLSSINRQEIYRVLESLQQLGLVQKNVCMPTTFLPTSITDAIKMLLAQKTAELAAIRQKTRQLAKKLQNSTSPTAALVEKPSLGTVFESDRAKKYRQAIQATHQKIDIVTSWKRFKQLTILLEAQLESALQKGITLCIATERPPSQLLPNWVANAQALHMARCFKLKLLSSPPAAAVAIFDQTTAAIAFHPDANLTQGPDLWTTNPTLLALSQAYFDNTWIQTEEQK